MRGSRRGGRHHDRNHRHFRAEESWIAKPVHDHSHQRQHEQNHEDINTGDSSSLPSSSQPLQISDFAAKSDKNHRNRSYTSRNRRGGGVKSQFVKKSDVGSSKSDAVGELSGEVGNLSVDDKVISERECVEKEAAESKTETSSGEREVTEPGNREDGVLGILNELRLGVKEPELTEEQLRMNDQAQEDELLAMESIYGENVFILGRQNELRHFQICVQIDASNMFTVTANLGSQSTVNESSDNFSYSFNIQYLPPIRLACLLPKSYPSHCPPYFTISVRWLNMAKISSLCSVLDSIWTEQPGQEVLYRWADWLQNASLLHLGFGKEIILGPYGTVVLHDKRAISGSVSLDVDIPYLRSYNDEKCHENFLKSFHECCICFSEYAGVDFARLPCQHSFCWKCMKSYSDIHVSEGTISKLKCPNSKCEGMVPPNMLKRLLGDEEYGRWESLTLQKTLESMTDIVYCPRCEMPSIEDEEHHVQCSKCFFSFCTLCREKRHVGVTCMTPEVKLRILQERQSSSQMTQDQRRREREMINEILSVKEMLKDAKQCPSCKMAISRIEGCNKMVCSNCGQYFCYCCNQAIPGYEHFRDGACDLFPQEMIQEWEERINVRQVVGQIQAQLFGQHGQVCPNCRQFNAKVGNNNHLFCWSCQVHYCYLCKKIVRRSSQHYGPKGCKQHTEG